MPNDWKNEDDIKAELRILTDELRTLRHELRNMVSPQKAKNPSRFLHRHSWPMPRLDSGTPHHHSDRADRADEPPKKKD